MADVTERLRVVIEADGTATLADGTRLSAEEVRKLGDQLGRTGGELQTFGTLSEKAGQHAVGLGRDIAQGDWTGAAANMGRLAMSTGAAEAATSGLGLSLGLAVAGVLAWAVAMRQAHQETERQANALLLTGNYAGLVGGQLNQMARDAAAGVNGSVGNVRGTMEELVATGRVTTQSLGEMAKSVELLTRFSGQSREAVTKDFASMGDGVATWAAKHNQSYHFITFEQYKYIESLEKAGQTQEAMRVTSEALSQHLGGDLTRNMGTLQRGWNRIKIEASAAWDAMLNLGREKTTQERVAEATTALENAEKRLQAVRNAGMLAGGGGAQKSVDDARAKLVAAQAEMAAERSAADERSRSAKEEEAKIAADREKKKREDDGSSTYDRMDQQLQRRLAMAQAEEAQNGRLSASERYRLDGLQQIADVEDKIGPQRAGRLRDLVTETAAVMRNNEAREDLRKTRERAAAMADKDIANSERELAAMQASNQRMQEQIEQIGLTTEQLARLKTERLNNAIAEEQLNLVMAQNIEGNDAQVRIIERRIELLERQRDLTQELGQKQADEEARRKAEAEAKKMEDQMRQGMINAIFHAFASGKSPMEAFGVMLENTVNKRAAAGLQAAIMEGAQSMARSFGGGGGGGMGGFFSSLFGGSGGGVDMGTATGADMSVAYTGYHSGGMVGGEPTFRRAASSRVFSGAPRFHGGGITGDEVPIIAKRGEGVFTPGQMKALGAGMGGGGVQLNLTVINNNNSQVSMRPTPGGGPMDVTLMIDAVDSGLADRASAGQSRMGQAMAERFGLREAVS